MGNPPDETIRLALPSKGHLYDGIIDLDSIVRDPNNQSNLLPSYDSGDHLHLNAAGYQAMANAIQLSLFGR